MYIKVILAVTVDHLRPGDCGLEDENQDSVVGQAYLPGTGDTVIH